MRWLTIFCFAPIIVLVLEMTQNAGAEEPPEPIAQLIDQGSVSFDYYDPRSDPMPYPGRADFRLRTPCRFQYSVATQRGATTTRVTVTVTFLDLKVERSHTVSLPVYLSGDRHWDNRLMLHEFDHVAISSDPRIDLLLEHLLRNISPLQLTIANDERIDSDWIGDQVNAAIDLRTEAMIDSIKENYVLLDDITSHGTRAIPDRQAFFEALYTKENFDHQAFPYTGELLDPLRSRAYAELELPYSFEEEDE